MIRRWWVSALIVVIVAAAASPSDASDAAGVLVVGNAASPASVRITEHYTRARSVPADNVLMLAGLPEDPPDVIARADFERLIHAPIARWIEERGAHDRLLYIVLIKGIPLRIGGTRGRTGTIASVDSELAVLYRRMTGVVAPITGAIPNPYFLGNEPIEAARPFSHEHFDIYLVTRLDGFTVDDVTALIDRGLRPSREGRVVLDERAGFSNKGNVWIRATADRLRERGQAARVVHEATGGPADNSGETMAYVSWGSADPALRTRRSALRFAPGAISARFLTSDARTFREPPAEWQVSGPPDRLFAGSNESLAGDLIRDGITGIGAHVAEPYLDGSIHPEILVPAYLAGFTLGEAYYLAIPSLGWQTVVVGDPLCAPFAEGPVRTSDGPPPIDPGTELPAWFSARRLATAQVPGLSREGVSAFLRAESREARGDEAGMVAALEDAVRLEPRLAAAHLLLASRDEQAGRYDKAEERYRAVLREKRDDVAALNNLAYLLAVRRNAPADGLGLAQRARTLAPTSPIVADTLGWIYHLLGDDRQAAALLTEAASSPSANADVLLHSAIVSAALGDRARARQTLDRALQLAPSLADGDEVRRLKERLAESR